MKTFLQVVVSFLCAEVAASAPSVMRGRRLNPLCAIPCVLGERDPNTCECVLSAKPPSRCDFLGTQCKDGEVCMEVGLAVVCLPDPQAAPTDACSLPMLTGPCFAYFPRYYYDKSTRSCQKFIYSGCHGNSNNFATLTQCLELCSPHKSSLNFLF